MNAVTLDELARQFDGTGVPRAVLGGALPALRLIAVGGVRQHFQQGRGPDGRQWLPLRHPRPDGSSKPLSDSGRLAASVSAATTPDGITLTASHPGANVHQYGATIRPMSARALAIPLTSEAKRIGSPRKNRFPRPLFVLKAKDSPSAVLAESSGGNVTAHYALRRMVVIPPRPYLGFSAETLSKVTAVLQTRALDWIGRQFLADTGPLVESWGLTV